MTAQKEPGYSRVNSVKLHIRVGTMYVGLMRKDTNHDCFSLDKDSGSGRHHQERQHGQIHHARAEMLH